MRSKTIGRFVAAWLTSGALAAPHVEAQVSTPTATFTATTFLTFTPTPTRTATRTPSSTPSSTATRTPSSTPSNTATRTASATFTSTRTPTATFTKTADPRPAIVITDVLAPEGLIGTRLFNFIVTLSKPSALIVTVHVATANGTATAGTDYIAVAGTLTFAPFQTSLTVPVQVIGDAVNEPFETFFVNLSAPTNAIIADNQGRGTITNDDVGVPSLMPRDGSVEAGERIALTLGWTHPERWRLLDTLDLRLRSADHVIGWVRFTEAPNTFSAVDPATGDAGPGSPPKSDVELTSAAATVFLHDSGWVESGANHERVDVTWQFGFDPSAAGQIYLVEAAATDDDGFSQPFEAIGTLAIGAVCAGDCGADGVVAVNELILAVNIATGELPLDACLAADENRNEAIEISDLIAAVNHALSGCPAS
jgi:Calx-beta domain